MSGAEVADGRSVFLAARRDGLGARLQAMLNAMVLAERFDGDVPLPLVALRARLRGVPRDPAEGGGVLARPSAPGTPMTRARSTGGSSSGSSRTRPSSSRARAGRFNVGFNRLEDALPQAARLLAPDAQRRAFDRVEFSPELARAKAAAYDVELPRAVAALHLRAGDIVYGYYRLHGYMNGKAMPWPLAVGLAERLRGRGDQVLVFGEDAALCGWVAARTGGVDVRKLCAGMGFDKYQAAIFEIALMSRAGEIYAGSSRFPAVACQIAGMRPKRANAQLGRREIRRRFLDALKASTVGSEVSDLQRAFAFSAAALRFERLFSADERDRFLKEAGARDPVNGLYDLARIRNRLLSGDTRGAAAALEALVVEDAGRGGERLLPVLQRLAGNFPNAIGVRATVQAFAGLAARDHVGALLCIALAGPDLAAAEAAAQRFLALRPPGLAVFDEAVGRVQDGGRRSR